jgi:hypothetical protein
LETKKNTKLKKSAKPPYIYIYKQKKMKRKKRTGGNRTVPVFFRAESVTAEKVLERERERESGGECSLLQKKRGRERDAGG